MKLHNHASNAYSIYILLVKHKDLRENRAGNCRELHFRLDI